MKERTRRGHPGGISDAAVKARTGKNWAEWGRILDAAGARKMPHKDIAAYVFKRYPKTGSWWAQMVTVGYEQMRGLREKNQAAGGFRVTSSRTVAAPVSALFRAWHDAKRRTAWLPHPHFTVRRARPSKSLRITWTDGRTSLDVNFCAKGAGKSLVAVEHSKLANAREVERWRAYWAKALEGLKTRMER